MAECSAIVVRPAHTVLEDALAMVARSMPLGEQTISLTVPGLEPALKDPDTENGAALCASATPGGENPESAALAFEAWRVVELRVISFPFEDHGVGGVLWQAAVGCPC